jgi:DNA-binding MarR family transcriptional regulator
VTHASRADSAEASQPASGQAASGQAAADGVDRIIGQWAHERPDLDTGAMATFGRIFRLARLAGDRVEKAYGAFGIGRSEFDVLATLRRAGEPYQLSPGALAASMMLSTGGTTARLDRLEKAGMVERSPSPTDRRGVVVRLTPHGFDVIDRAVGAGLAEQERLLAHLPAGKRRQLDDLLREALQQPTSPVRGDMRWME